MRSSASKVTWNPTCTTDVFFPSSIFFPVASLAFGDSSKVVKNCHQEFEQVKSQRFHRFSKCFEHVSVVIDQIYKRMCRNSSAQVRQHT